MERASASTWSPSIPGLRGGGAALHKREESRISRPSPRCPNCPSRKIVRDGRRRAKRKGPVQKYLCRRCGTRLSGIPGLKGRRATSGVIADAPSQVSKGMSPAKVANEMSRKGNDFSRSTIHGRAVAYGHMMAVHVKECRPWVGYRWHCDEAWFRVRGGDAYLFAVMGLFHQVRIVQHGVSGKVRRGAAWHVRGGGAPGGHRPAGVRDRRPERVPQAGQKGVLAQGPAAGWCT